MSRIVKSDLKLKVKSSPKELLSNHGIWKALFKISFPIVILMLSDATYSVFDTIMAANYVEYGNGINASDVLGFLQPVLGSFFSLTMLFIVGTTLSFTKSLAKNDVDLARREFGNGVTSGVAMTLSLFIILWFGSNPIIHGYSSLGTPLPDVAITEGTNYARITGISFMFMLLKDQFGRVLRSEGHGTKYAFFSIISIPINLFFNWFFMEYIGIGLEGAAFATMIASSFAFFLIFSNWFILKIKRKTNISLSPKYFVPKLSLVWIVVLFGLSSAVRRTFTAINNLSFISVVNTFGENWKQWLSATTKTSLFTSQLTLGIAQGSSILISFAHFGNEKDVSVKEIIKKTAIAIFVMQSVIFVATSSASIQIMNLFNLREIIPEMKSAWYFMITSWILFSMLLIPIIYYSTVRLVKESILQAFIQNFIFGVVFIFAFFGIYKASGSNNTDIFFSVVIVSMTLSVSIIYPRFIKILNKNYPRIENNR